MENQVNVGDQNTQPVGQNPSSQPPMTSIEKPKVNYWMISTVVLLITSIIGGLLTYNLSRQVAEIKKALPTPTELPTTSFEPSETPAPTTAVKTSLSEAFSKYCANNKIALDKLPFTLGQTLKSAYKIQNTIDCFVPDENYARISIIIHNPPDFSGDKRYIYFFHQGSQFQGMGNVFQSLSNYKPVTINGQNLWLNVRDPDPYGTSTLGVWVDFINEKKDVATGTIVRAFNLEIFKDQDILDLVKKYGVKQTDPSSPEYVITDPSKKAQFIEEIIKIASTHNAFRKPAQNVASDLNGVTF